MTVRDTSLETYYNDIEPKLGDKQRTVYLAIQMSNRPVNNDEIATYLGQPINTVTPRVNELVKLGKVELAAKDIHPKTNRRVCYWRPVK